MECPHCGEPLENDAENCPSCGSDDETGWKSDLDYYAVELPEDDFLDEESFEQPVRSPWPNWVGYAVLTLALVALVAVGFTTYSWGVLLPLLFLALCALIYCLGTKEPRSSR